MPRSFCPLGLLTLGLLLAAGPAAFADPVSWTYGWSADTTTIAADPGGAGTITLTPGPGSTTSGPGSIAALSFSTLTTATDAAPDHFTGGSYGLTLDLTDNSTHASGSLHFLGRINGTLSAANDLLFLGFDHFTGHLDLGGDQFDVALTLPPQPGLGIVSAQVSIGQGAGGGTPPPGPGPGPGPQPGPEPGPQNSPEPSALVLAALGLVGVGVQAWRRRRTGRAAR